MNKFFVYKHTFPNNKVYIGITQQQPEERWKNGLGYKGAVVFNAIQKYGWDNIKHEVLFSGLTQEEAEQKEIELIQEYNSADHIHGYNIALGGSHGGKQSEETKEKISKKNKGRKRSPETIQKNKEKIIQFFKDNPEARKKIGEASRKRWSDPEYRKKLSEERKGKGVGRIKSPEEIEKIRLANIGRKHSEETKKKISEANKRRGQEWRDKLSYYARNRSPETIEKLRKASTGVKQSEETKRKRAEKLKGRKRTPEMIEKYKEAQNNRSPEWENKRLKAVRAKTCKKVANIDGQGVILKTFNSAMECASFYNIKPSSVSSVCRGSRKTTHGLKFKYIE